MFSYIFSLYTCCGLLNLKPTSALIFTDMYFHVVKSTYLSSTALSLLQGRLHDVLRQCRAPIRRRYRVKCVSLEQIPAERNAATRERNIFRDRFPPGQSPSTAHPVRYIQFDLKLDV